MAVPPIIPSNPVPKTTRTEQQDARSDTAPQADNTPRDVVEISAAALEKLESAQISAIENDAQARAASETVRNALGGHEDQTLGLNPDFVE